MIKNSFIEKYFQDSKPIETSRYVPVTWVKDGKRVPPWELARLFRSGPRSIPSRAVDPQDRMRVRNPSRQAIRELQELVWWSSTLKRKGENP